AIQLRRGDEADRRGRRAGAVYASVPRRGIQAFRKHRPDGERRPDRLPHRRAARSHRRWAGAFPWRETGAHRGRGGASVSGQFRDDGGGSVRVCADRGADSRPGCAAHSLPAEQAVAGAVPDAGLGLGRWFPVSCPGGGPGDRPADWHVGSGRSPGAYAGRAVAGGSGRCDQLPEGGGGPGDFPGDGRRRPLCAADRRAPLGLGADRAAPRESLGGPFSREGRSAVTGGRGESPVFATLKPQVEHTFAVTLARDGPQQLPGELVLRIVEDLLGEAQLHLAALAHHADRVADLPDDGEVVGDEQVCQAQFLLQLVEQLQNAGLHGDVQRGYGLVENQQFRFQDQRAGDGHALALPAGELPGTTAGQRLGQADLIQYLGDLRADLRSRERTEVSQRLGDRRTDGLAWVQRAIGVLVDHLQPTAQLARVLRREIVDGSALEVGGARAGLLEGADHAGEGGLAGTR